MELWHQWDLNTTYDVTDARSYFTGSYRMYEMQDPQGHIANEGDYLSHVNAKFDDALKDRPNLKMVLSSILEIEEQSQLLYQGTAEAPYRGIEDDEEYRAGTNLTRPPVIASGLVAAAVNTTVGGIINTRFPLPGGAAPPSGNAPRYDIRDYWCSGPNDTTMQNTGGALGPQTSVGMRLQFFNFTQSTPAGGAAAAVGNVFASEAKYNTTITRAQLFSALDAAALLWNARTYFNPSDGPRPEYTDHGQSDEMHYWCRTYVESFLSSREEYKKRNETYAVNTRFWEKDVKMEPQKVFPTQMIGALCERSWKELFPLLPAGHAIRDDLRRVRALSVMWGTLPSYMASSSMPSPGAWMPLSQAHKVRLLTTVGLFDSKHHIPSNPWIGRGLSDVYNQSYHSVYHVDSYRDKHFREWLQHACRYQPPDFDQSDCKYPFSRYGGTPVQADFIPHLVEAPATKGAYLNKRHAELVYNRFGITEPLKVGQQQFHDAGLLQDMFQFEYRQTADLSDEQRKVDKATKVRISNFLAYARTHSILALASCNEGTEDMSIPQAVRNLYRVYVDTYKCAGLSAEDDGVPAVMGFLPQAVNDPREDRSIVMYAATLPCLNSKMEIFCNSQANRGERVCHMYKQVHLNDATIIFTRLLRAERRKMLHKLNYGHVLVARGGDMDKYSRNDFNEELINLQDSYIEFLHTTLLGILIESGSDLNKVPLHLLEPRELAVSMRKADENMVGTDLLSNRTRVLSKSMDFGGEFLSQSQIAHLSLIPPNNRILGTMRLDQSTQIQDMDYLKKQIQKATIESNKKAYDRYLQALIDANLAVRFLEASGVSADLAFDSSSIKNPLDESAKIGGKMVTTQGQHQGTIARRLRAEGIRADDGPYSISGLSQEDVRRALQHMREKVEREYERKGGDANPRNSRLLCLDKLRPPPHVQRILEREYRM